MGTLEIIVLLAVVGVFWVAMYQIGIRADRDAKYRTKEEKEKYWEDRKKGKRMLKEWKKDKRRNKK